MVCLIVVEICALFDYCGDLCFVCILWRSVLCLIIVEMCALFDDCGDVCFV